MNGTPGRDYASFLQMRCLRDSLVQRLVGPMGLVPQVRHFPQRNRLIAALASATVVVEAAARSAGCPVAYLEFAGEGHGFRQGPNIVRALQAELVFLGRVFGHHPAETLPPLSVDNAGALPGA